MSAQVPEEATVPTTREVEAMKEWAEGRDYPDIVRLASSWLAQGRVIDTLTSQFVVALIVTGRTKESAQEFVDELVAVASNESNVRNFEAAAGGENRDTMSLESALAKLRQSTEMALSYPDARITPGEARALLQHIDTITATSHQLQTARDKWYAKEARLRKNAVGRNAEIRSLRDELTVARRDLRRLLAASPGSVEEQHGG